MVITRSASERVRPGTAASVNAATASPTTSRTGVPKTKACRAGAAREIRPSAISTSSRTAATGDASLMPVTNTTPRICRMATTSDGSTEPPPIGRLS